jgi:RND family efflux transporter MFP subunit
MTVKAEDLNRALEYVGNIKGEDEAIVYPKVSGKIIEKVREEGEYVNKGDVIAYIDRDEVGLKFEKAPVESPLAGAVGRVYVDIGSSVTTQTPIAFISDLDKVEISLDIPEKYLPRISIGQDAIVEVDAYPGEKFIGKVDVISPIVDLQTRTAPIEITIDNKDHRLQSGMFARIKLVIEGYRGVPVILKEAVMGKSPDQYVYAIEGGCAVSRKVTLGIRQGPYYQVIDGVTTGDMVVVMGQQKLKDGASVAVEE